MSTASGPPYGLTQLASEAGLPVGTVKYYLRERLLPEGRKRSATRADYGAEHLQRLRLLRLLREVGDVPVDRLRDLVVALERRTEDPVEILAAGASAVAGPAPAPGPLAGRAERLARELGASVGWTTLPPEAQEWDALRAVLETVLGWEEAGLPVSSSGLTPYAEAADTAARHDVDALGGSNDPTTLLTQLVVGQVVYGRLLDTMRRLAEAEHSVRRWRQE